MVRAVTVEAPRAAVTVECPNGCGAMERTPVAGPGRRPAGSVAKHLCRRCGYQFWETQDGLPCWSRELRSTAVREFGTGRLVPDVHPDSYPEVERRKAVMRQFREAPFKELRQGEKSAAEGLDSGAETSPHDDVIQDAA